MEELELNVIISRAVGGVFALISRNIVLKLIATAASLIVFSKLSPGDVGIYTIVVAFQQVLSFFTDFGLGAALVQKKEQVTQADITTVFTLQALVTFGIFIFVLLLLQPITQFLKLNTAGVYLLLSLVFSIFLSSFKLIPSILLERKIQFSKLVIPHIIESLTFNLILIMLVLQNYGVMSYTWAFLISSLVGIPVYYYISPWKFSFGIERKSLHLLKFGTQFQLKNILATIKDNLLFIFLPKFLPLSQIGYIGFAQKISLLPYGYFVDTVTKVMFSAYARMQHDTAVMKKAIEKSLFFISFAIFPTMIGLIITMPHIIQYMPLHWNNKWEATYTSIIFFSLNAILSSLSSILINVLDANGKVKITLYLMVLWTILTWVLTPLLIVKYGFDGVAMASFLISLTIGITIILVKRIVEFRFFKSIYKPAIASICMGVLVLFMDKFLVTNLFSLIVIMIVGGVIYMALMFILARNEVKKDLRLLLKKG